MKNTRGFASDNNAGVHPEIMAAIQNCNSGHEVGYGDDPYTRKAEEQINLFFGQDTEVFFVFNGTAANVVGLRNMTQSYNSIICAESAHIQEDECGAPEMFTGCKLIPLETHQGKLTVESIIPHVKGIGFEHHSQPRVVSITQATELGTVYSTAEIRTIADYVHSKNMLLHMDGARIANAAVSLGISLRETTRDAGVDVLSFGGTKNGAMYGEAILLFTPGLSSAFKYIRKQSMQLASKMRYIAVQFEALLTNDLWLRNASHANAMARILAEKAGNIPGVEITRPVDANGVFAVIPERMIVPLQDEFFFYIWDEKAHEVRWMTSWDTTEQDIDKFVHLIRSLA
ncbi:MAG: threonine aldolase [Bacteroidetes bacterium GWF2_49_14]|nr:MAG: threonine aldolase [Bacteroidetes bacterium GWF2_49_14]HBB92726.1 threonine aldolase [Bacteroidales bacterium]